VANYIRTDLGALAGNFYFGCLLGAVSGLGVMLGMPLDIRHVTFVAAFFGFSSAALDFQLTYYLIGTERAGDFLSRHHELVDQFLFSTVCGNEIKKSSLCSLESDD
jgi:hypothetical protein